MRAAALLLALLATGCYGTSLHLGVGRTFEDGGSSGSVMGKHGFAGTWDVDTEDSTTVSAGLVFNLTPPTVLVKSAEAHESDLHPLMPPPDVMERIYAVPLPMRDEPAPPAAVAAAPEKCETGGRPVLWIAGGLAALLVLAVLWVQRRECARAAAFVASLPKRAAKKARRAPRGK